MKILRWVKPYWSVLARYVAPQRGRVALLGGMLLVSIGFQLLTPILLARFIDQAIAGQPLAPLLQIGLLFIGIALLAQLAAVAESYVAELIGWTATNELRAELALHCLKLDTAFHRRHTPGELIERIDGDVNQLANFFSRFAIQVLGNLLLMLGALGMLYRIDWRVGLALTVFIGATIAIWLAIQRIAMPYWEREREVSAGFFGFVGEQLRGAEDLQANGAHPFVFRRLATIMREWLSVQRRTVLASYAPFMTSLAILALGTIVAFGLGAYLFTQGQISIGTVYLIFQYTELLRQPVDQLRAQFADLQQASASVARVQTLLGTASLIQEQPTAALPAGPLAVGFDAVTFGYDQAEPVFRDLSFQLAAGTTLGILGRTGSGKTTIARLLLRSYDPADGSITLGGTDVRAVAVAEVRARVGIVTQEVRIFHASVRDNLTFFNPAIPDEQLEATLEAVSLTLWLRRLPHGLDTTIQGGSLSGGEAQLLGLARIFLKDPSLVILDEASSRLDNATERLVQQAVERLLQGRTGIIIAHRLATVQAADAILILEDGRIREYGGRESLLADESSLFAQLLRTSREFMHQ